MKRFYELKNKNKNTKDQELDQLIEQYQSNSHIDIPSAETNFKEQSSSIWISEARQQLLLDEIRDGNIETEPGVFASLFFTENESKLGV